jgi:preprotein translocase subunit SecF
MGILKHKKLFYIISSSLAVISIAALIIWKLSLGIDFTGGSMVQVQFSKSLPTLAQMTTALNVQKLNAQIQQVGTDSYAITTQYLNEQAHNTMLQNLAVDLGSKYPFTESQFTAVGPVIGSQLKAQATEAVVLVIILIALYIAFAFRKISQIISSWKYGVVTVVTLFHDVIITMGVFAIWAHFTNFSIGVPFVAAMLTVLGYSVHDTIVVFDRIRENLLRYGTKEPLFNVVDVSLTQTFSRSVNTSLTVLITLFAIYLLGSANIKDFVLVLLVGIVIGTYSSICIASPLIFDWSQRRRAKGKR